MQRRKTSIVSALQERLAAENRRVLSDWRAVVYLRRASTQIPPGERRWKTPPNNVLDVRPILVRLSKAGEFAPIEGFPFLCCVRAPYARSGAVEEEEVLMELHPYAALSHISALTFHQMTEQLSKEIHASMPDDGPSSVTARKRASDEDRSLTFAALIRAPNEIEGWRKGTQPVGRRTSAILPLGTRSEDWEGVPLVRGRVADFIFNRRINWHRLAGKRIFGTFEYDYHGYSVRVATPERTLLDGLLHPDWCGGFINVLRAWAGYRDLIDVEALVQYVDQFDIRILRQRAGFLMEELDIRNPALDLWVTQARRGGSSKLNGGAKFSSQFNERWRLSINAPIDALREART